MKLFEILCVTMNQRDFSKIKEMNINSNVVFANQCDINAFSEFSFNGHHAKMISTNTHGVGINRNIALQYASADVCLFADDDVLYKDDVEQIVLDEFSRYPKADIIVFNLDTDNSERKQRFYKKTRKVFKWERMPWGCVRVAFKLSAIRKANLWFTALFGGGCIFPAGEDSLWLLEAKKKKLCMYVSNKTIGKVSFCNSSWFTGYDEKYYYGKGAFYAATHPFFKFVWYMYFLLRTSNKKSKMSFIKKLKWMRFGADGYKKMISFENYLLSKDIHI